MFRMGSLFLLLGVIAVVTALPTIDDDLVIKKSDEQRFQYMREGDGTAHLVDTWLKTSDLRKAARFHPDTQNVYHLFTRLNPTVSQPILLGASGALASSNFNRARRTIIIIHGWIDNLYGALNSVLIPAFLAAEDVNVISVDWSAGGGTLNYATAVVNTVISGQSVGRFINWLNQVSGSRPDQLHIVGHSLGGHQAGIAGRNVNGNVAYITSLDPALPGWITNEDRFRANDGAYTEVIHTNAGALGYTTELGHVDFYPNGGVTMPGCNGQACDHDRCFHYLAESLRSGGFTGTQCATAAGAMTGNCVLWGRLRMGGLAPKTGSTGIYYLETNAHSPFSRG